MAAHLLDGVFLRLYRRVFRQPCLPGLLGFLLRLPPVIGGPTPITPLGCSFALLAVVAAFFLAVVVVCVFSMTAEPCATVGCAGYLC